MANTLADIRARLREMEEKKSNVGSKQGGGDNTVYPHWNIQEGESALLRFLPDGDPNNSFFWVERAIIRLTYPGVKGGDQSKPVTVQVPCGEMYGDNCPVLTAVRPFFKANDPSLEELGRKYWKKRSYIFQGFVVEDPLNEDDAPENPIRRFMINPQIFNIIKEALMDPDLENLPTDYDAGADFRVKKTSKGQYADYTTSKWRTVASALTEEQRAAIDTHGLHDLKDFLPERPTQEQYDIILEMFEASVDGELYDPEKWGQHYKPYGLEVPQVQTTSAPAQESTPTPEPTTTEAVQEAVDSGEVKAPEAEAKEISEAPKKSAEDVLALIRNRQ